MKEKRLFLLMFLFGAIFIILGSTFAYLSWRSSEEQKTNVVFTITGDFSCAVDGGGNITSSDVILIPTTVTEATSGNYIKREVKVKPAITKEGKVIYMDLWLDIKNIGTGLSNSNNFMYSFTTSSVSPTEGIISSGNFKGKKVGDKINLLLGNEYTATITETYYLWIWLDAKETSSETMNQRFSLSLNGNCNDRPYQIDMPQELIPIKYEDDGTVRTVSINDNSWGNYDNKEWANAVLVSQSKRETYQNSVGVEISENDILAYYVYIPRYKYKIWQTELSDVGEEQEIEIIFENKNISKSNGSNVGEYLTHPAFTFDNIELNGIWIGKFETGGNTYSPLIKPYIRSLVQQNVSQAFETSRMFMTYGITSDTDSHMAKNSEWSSAAYLAQSKYGRCTNGVCEEVNRNNNSEFLTGFSAVNAATTEYSKVSSSTNEFGYNYAITQPYNTEVGYKASTTGNIYGVYDMSGGAWEYVMGVLADPSGRPRSGYTTTENSGYRGLLANGSMYSSGIDFPNSKYYDLYKSTNLSSNDSSLTLTACNGGVCYGHGLSEVNNWYDDYSSFLSSIWVWVSRGGRFNDGISAGLFNVSGAYGGAYSEGGSRAVLTLMN